jgi:hypothetical protein
VAASYPLFGRRWQLSWGATEPESHAALPGDELLGSADLTATRAISIRASADGVWPWIAQLGQGRGGFYSYDLLENLVGCDIHSSDRIVPEWQHVEVGDESHSRAQRRRTTSRGHSRFVMDQRGRRGCSSASVTHTRGRGRG